MSFLRPVFTDVPGTSAVLPFTAPFSSGSSFDDLLHELVLVRIMPKFGNEHVV